MKWLITLLLRPYRLIRKWICAHKKKSIEEEIFIDSKDRLTIFLHVVCERCGKELPPDSMLLDVLDRAAYWAGQGSYTAIGKKLK